MYLFICNIQASIIRYSEYFKKMREKPQLYPPNILSMTELILTARNISNSAFIIFMTDHLLNPFINILFLNFLVKFPFRYSCFLPFRKSVFVPSSFSSPTPPFTPFPYPPLCPLKVSEGKST